jgi:hypothetical protein
MRADSGKCGRSGRTSWSSVLVLDTTGDGGKALCQVRVTNPVLDFHPLEGRPQSAGIEIACHARIALEPLDRHRDQPKQALVLSDQKAKLLVSQFTDWLAAIRMHLRRQGSRAVRGLAPVIRFQFDQGSASLLLQAALTHTQEPRVSSTQAAPILVRVRLRPDARERAPHTGCVHHCDNRTVNVGRLLDDLCVRLGYCLPAATQQRIIADPPPTVDAFTDAVIEAQGLDPVIMDKRHRLEVRRIVAAAFGEPIPPATPGNRRAWTHRGHRD